MQKVFIQHGKRMYLYVPLVTVVDVIASAAGEEEGPEQTAMRIYQHFTGEGNQGDQGDTVAGPRPKLHLTPNKDEGDQNEPEAAE